MQAAVLKTLEFDQVAEVVRQFAVTPFGADALARLVPFTDARRVEAALQGTSEGVRFLTDSSGFPLRGAADLVSTLSALAVAGRPLEAQRLLSLADFLESVARTAQGIRRDGRDSLPLLRRLAEDVKSFDPEIQDIRRKIEPSGDVADHASPELRLIRDRLRKQRARLRSTLESYLRGRETARYLQEQIVTERSGRYVLVVRTEHRGSIPGIVHGASTSGASLYLEPLSTVEVNNDIVALEEQEAEEVRRILLELTDAFRNRALDLQHTIEAAAELDVIQAKARFSQLVGGVSPALTADGRFELRAARHPLLIPAVAKRLSGEAATEIRNTDPVAVDILLLPPTTVLVISGPNTGGKTVALKTAGLLALMAQAGLHVPAEAGSRLPVFRSLFADIGDEQSIAANLSTFSWHVTNIASMDRQLTLPALILLDEVGAGTDPTEGGALGTALIEHFRQRGALIVATTHYDVIKSYSSTTQGVTSAAFGFDEQTFAPTYSLRYGAPGASLAFEIASRLGLAPSIIEHARKARTAREAQLADHLTRVDRDLQSLEHERRLVAREREQLASLEAQWHGREQALRQREEAARRKLDDQLAVRLREARQEIDATIDNLKRRTDALAEAAKRTMSTPATGETGGLRAEARAKLDELTERYRQLGDPTQAAAAGSETPAEHRSSAGTAGPPPALGARVSVGPLGLEGIVQAVHDRDAEVSVNGKRLRVSLDSIRLISSGPRSSSKVDVQVQLQPGHSALGDLNVIGRTVDEAVSMTDKFLDGAILAEQRQIRVIHGHGTGQLRRALAEFLGTHPLVLRISPAPPEQGGNGVTVVELKE